MSLKDRFQKADETQRAAEKIVNERWDRSTDAFNVLFESIRTMVKEAGAEIKDTTSEVRDPSANLHFAVPEIVLNRAQWSVQISV